MMTTHSVFQQALRSVLSEILDGPSGSESYVLFSGDPGLLGQLDTISAVTASQHPLPGKPSIAAHVDHVGYYISLVNRWAAGEVDPWTSADWKASWQRTTVTEEQWHVLRGQLRREAHQLQQVVASRQSWDKPPAANALGAAVHTAYHLGAIRQILAVVLAKANVT